MMLPLSKRLIFVFMVFLLSIITHTLSPSPLFPSCCALLSQIHPSCLSCFNMAHPSLLHHHTKTRRRKGQVGTRRRRGGKATGKTTRFVPNRWRDARAAHPGRTLPPSVVVFSATVPMHPQDPRSTRVVTSSYENLKPTTQSPLPPLCENTFASSTSAVTKRKRGSFEIFYFVHIPKTGGAALKRSLAECADPLNSLRDPPQNLLLSGVPHGKAKTRPRFVRVLSRGHLSASAIDPRINTFALLRDPFERVRSAFRFVLGGGEGSEVWGEHNHVIRKLRDVFVKHRIQSISDIFERPASDVVRQQILEHSHFKPMVHFVCSASSPSVPIVDRLFALETFRPSALARYLGIAPFKMCHKNKSSVPYILTDKDRECIREHYAADFDLYRNAVPARDVLPSKHAQT
jgi:hypothetical protein